MRIKTPFTVCKYLHLDEMTDDVIHSTQFYIKFINRAILTNLQRRPLKLGRILVLQETHIGV